MLGQTLGTDKVTEDLIKKDNYHLFVNVFYADKKEEMEELIRFGADAILTNYYPDLLLRVQRDLLKRKGQK